MKLDYKTDTENFVISRTENRSIAKISQFLIYVFPKVDIFLNPSFFLEHAGFMSELIAAAEDFVF